MKDKEILKTIYKVLKMLNNRKDTKAIINYYLLKTSGEKNNLENYISMLENIIDNL